MTMNNQSFDDKRIAKGYAKDRPWLHKLVMKQIQTDCSVKVVAIVIDTYRIIKKSARK